MSELANRESAGRGSVSERSAEFWTLAAILRAAGRLVVLTGAGCSTRKPAVVFFGESVPPQKVAVAMERLDEADALLVAGSSLTVWSGFRFVKRAAARNIPIAIVNLGPTRGDPLTSLKIDAA